MIFAPFQRLKDNLVLFGSAACFFRLLVGDVDASTEITTIAKHTESSGEVYAN